MIDTSAILQMASQYDAVTFDVFDTLLLRDVREPVDVYRLAYGSVGRYFRSLAEIIARKRSESGEVSLKDIERFCPFSCQPEIETEQKLCRANPELFALFQKLQEQGKRLYAISDMYLDRGTISELLHQAGYDLPVFVSSEYGCDKRSGKLYQAFLEKTGLSAAQILHIGDNAEADGAGAQKAGIRSVLIERHRYTLHYTRYRLSGHELAAFLNHGVAQIEDPVERLGYEIIGPIVLSYCQWVHAQYQAEGFERLYFLARDMHFIYDIYRTLYPEPAYYLRVSRRSLRFARENPEEFIAYLKENDCCGNTAIVDTGWVGVAQTEIESYARQLDPQTDMGGLYMGTKLSYRLRKRSARSHACFYSGFFEQIASAIQSSFLEALIGTDEKQVIAYRDGQPVFDRTDDRSSPNSIKDGARRFAEDWIRIKGNRTIAPRAAKPAFQRLFYCPAKQDMALLGHLHYEDFKDTAIVSYRENYAYWKHPGQFLSDLGDSAWKGAFLKCTGILYPFLLAAYSGFGAARILAADFKRYRKKEI